MFYNVKEIHDLIGHLSDCMVDGLFTENEVESFVAKIPNKILDFTWDTGATKLVLIPFKRDYVIKIPFNASDEYEYFDYTDDYCDREIRIYQEAVENNFEKFFLPIEECFTINGYPIYVQEKATPYRELEENKKKTLYSNKSFSTVKSKMIYESRLPLCWTASCLDILQSELYLKEFLRFLEDNDIMNDLHYGNIGYRFNRPVIFDYGGYYENF